MGPASHLQQSGEGTLIIPVYSIFGSEELSSAGAAVSQKIPEPFALMSLKDADILEVKEGDMVQLEIQNKSLLVKVRIENTMGRGMAGLSVNLPGMPFIDIPGRGKISKH